MAIVTTIQQVKDIYSKSGATDGEITAAISLATAMVTQQLSGLTGATTAVLTQVQLLLSAHFLAVNVEKGGLAEEEIGDARDRYNVQAAAGLASTRYGQQAIAFDPTGTLATLGKSSASFTTFPLALTRSG